MADFDFGLKIVWKPSDIDAQIKKIQEYIDKNHKLTINLNLDAIKGLDQIIKAISPSISQVDNLNSSVRQLGNTIQNLNKQSTIEIFKGGQLVQTKEIKELETVFGQLLKITKEFQSGEETKSIIENTTNYRKQREAIDSLNASKIRLLQSLDKYKGRSELTTEIEQIEKSIKSLDLTNITKANIQQIKQQINLLSLLAANVDKTEKTLDRQSKLLNNRLQSALQLGVKINGLSPDSNGLLNHQLERYKNIIKTFQEKNELGITIDEKKLAKIQNLENRIKRLYETIKQEQKDSHGFDFTKYEKIEVPFKELNKEILQSVSLLKDWKLVSTSGWQETENYIKIIQHLRQGSELKNIGIYVNKATGEVHQFNEDLKNTMIRSWGVGAALKTAFEKAVTWSVVMGGLYGVLRTLQQIPAVLVEIDTRLTEMSKVMSSDTDFGALMKNLVQSANDYGRTITEVQDAVVEFAKQGYEAAQAAELANTALLGANVTGLKTGEMAEYLTATMAQFNLTAKDSVSIVNKINEVDNNFAVTSQGLAQGIAKAGESAQQFGVTIDELIGMITAIQTATKESGSQIGNMLKTVFARINSDNAIKALESIGVATKDVTGELRSATQIYADVAAKWDTLTQAQKTYIGEALAGKYHITRLMSLFDNWNIVTEATKTSQQSLFSALEENRKHLQSLEAQMNKVKSAGQELSYTLGEKGLKSAMFDVLGVTRTFINGLTELANASVLGKIGFTALIVSITGLTIGFASLIPIVRTLTTEITAMILRLATNPFGMTAITITGLVTATALYLGKQKQLREEQEKVIKTVEESTKAFNELKSSLEKVGEPTLQNINDAEAQIKAYDKLINTLNKLKNQKEIMDIVGYGSIEVEKQYNPNELSQELKDLASNLGINIYQIKTWAEFLTIAKQKQDELSKSLEEGRKNSTEYQKSLLQQKQTEVNNAESVYALVQEYKELSNVANKNAEQTKRFVEVENILASIFPTEFQNRKNLIPVLEEESSKRLKTAQAAEEEQKRILLANRAKLQNEYETAIKTLAILEAEYGARRDLANEIDKTNTNLQGLNIIDQASTYGYIERIRKAIAEIDDALNLKPQLSSTSSSSSSELESSYQDPTDAIIRAINLQAELTKAKNETLKAQIEEVRATKDYNRELELTSQFIRSQQQYIDELIYSNKQLNAQISQIGHSDWFDKNGEATQAWYNQYNSASKDAQEQMDKEFNKLQKLIKARNENTQAIKDSIVAMLEAQRNSDLDQLQNIQDKVIKQLQELSKTTDEFDYGKFADEIENIIYELNKIQGNYPNGFSPIDTSFDALNRLNKYRSSIISIANEVRNFANQSSKNTIEMESIIRNEINYADQLKDKLEQINNEIRDKTLLYKQQEDELERNIKATSDWYDAEIEKQREKLKNLDEEIQKEDRLAQLRDINDQIEKTKADKRFSYIDAQGNEILTYDKAKVAELEKNRDDLVKQFQREDLRKAIEDEIDRLEKQRDDKLRILQEELDNARAIHQQELDSLRLYADNLSDLYSIINSDIQSKIDTLNNLYDENRKNTEKSWNDFINAVKTGTEGFDALMNGDKGWYQQTINNLQSFSNSVAQKVAAIAGYFASLKNLEVPSIPSSGVSSSGGSEITVYGNAIDLANAKEVLGTSGYKFVDISTGNYTPEAGSLVLGGPAVNPNIGEGFRIYGSDREATKNALEEWKKNYTYHTGGVVGGAPSTINNIISKLFGIKPDEQIAVLQKGEVVLNLQQQNILGNVFNNMRSIISNLQTKQSQPQVIKQYILNNPVIKADNPMQLFQGIEHLILSE